MNPFRLFLLIFAVGMIPFAWTSYNGAWLLGVASIITFIVLTIVGEPRKASK